MKHRIPLAVLIVAAIAFASPQAAFSQALPWQVEQVGNVPQAPAQHHGHKKAGNPASGDRDADDRRLADLAAKFYRLHEKDKDAIANMKRLEGEVSHFAGTLKGKSNEADILKDTRNLKNRITRQRKEWESRQTVSAPAKS